MACQEFTILSGLERHTADVRPMAELLRVPRILRGFKYGFPRLTQRESMDQLLQLISRCKVAESITSFLPPEHAIAEEDEEEQGEGARDDPREAEDVMETDNDDEKLCPEEVSFVRHRDLMLCVCVCVCVCMCMYVYVYVCMCL